MSSKRRAPHTAPETADRIRAAAISEFAARGFTRTTVRRIAETAGVSPGLVIHHFGSKEKLREACDGFVFTELTEMKRGKSASPAAVSTMFAEEQARVYVDYLSKSLLDPSASGQRFFDHYVEVVENYIETGFAGYSFRKGEDRRAQAAAIAMFGLAPSLLEPRIRHWLGTQDFAGTIARLGPSIYDLYLHGFIESGESETSDSSAAGAVPDGG